MEIWKDIEGYEGLYQVSNHGRVKSLARKVRCKNNSFRQTEDRIITLKHDKYGYNILVLHNDKKRKTCKVHRLVAKHFIPNPNNKEHVNHKNSIRDDNNVSNLEWVTPRENSIHGIKHGYANCNGEKHSKAKLTNLQAKEIRELYAKGNHTYQQLGDMYGVPKQKIYRIIKRMSYKEI